MSNEAITMTSVSQLSDAALSELFAVKVAGMINRGNGHWEQPPMRAIFKFEPDFAVSVDAVLPLLNGWVWRAGGGDTSPHPCTVTISRENGRVPHDSKLCFHGKGLLPRALCIALLAANGITEVAQ